MQRRGRQYPFVINIFRVIALTRKLTLTFDLDLGLNDLPGGVECLYEFNLFHHVGVVVKRLRAAAGTTIPLRNKYFSSYRVNKKIDLDLDLGLNDLPGGVKCLYEFNLFHHVGVVAKKLRAAAETTIPLLAQRDEG